MTGAPAEPGPRPGTAGTAPGHGGDAAAVSLRPGTRARARLGDPDHHTRVPRYVRGHTGEVIEAVGEWPLPDDVARAVAPPRQEMVYAVRFPAAALWGAGAHQVVVELWESYLEVAG